MDVLIWSALGAIFVLARLQQSSARGDAILMEKQHRVSANSDRYDAKEASYLSSPSFDFSHTYWTNGDIRLVSSEVEEEGGEDTPITSGLLEIYMTTLLEQRREVGMWGVEEEVTEVKDGREAYGTWGAVCGWGFALKEANVACRQLGFASAQNFALKSTTGYDDVGNESSPIFLEGINCRSKHLNHLMRCRAKSQTYFNCTHDYDVIIYCDSTRLWTNPYRGQIRLVNANSTYSMSSGRVEVYQSGTWGTVCNHEEQFHEAAADTVCRQLGYTNALAVTNAMPGSGLVWVDSITCESSAACFKHCYRSKHWSHVCNHTTDVAVQCTYDVSNSIENTAGSRSKCKIPVFPLSLLVLIILTVFAFLTLLGCALVVAIVLARQFCCYKKHSRRRYNQLA